MLILFSLVIFWGILFYFGWLLSRVVLKENKIEVLIPLALIIGISVYSFILNTLSYLIKIQINFYLVLIVLTIISCFLFRFSKSLEKTTWGIDKKWRKILFTTCFLIMIPTGIFALRTVGETSHLAHLPLAATIAEGNFPVKDVFCPNFYSAYHYGSSLFIAAVSKTTNLPLWFGYDLFNFIIIGVLFLLGFILIKSFCKNDFKAYLGSLAMILAGNLNFIYAFKGLYSLYQKYVLSLSVDFPFKFLHSIFFGEANHRVTSFIADASRITWVGLGFALTLAVVYLYFKAINDKDNWFKISLLTSVIFAFLALSAEVFFGVLGVVLFIYPLIYAFLKKDWANGKFYLKVSVLVLILGGLSAIFLGGTITQIARGLFLDYNYPIGTDFSITAKYILKGLIYHGYGYVGVTNEYNSTTPIFSLSVFLGWGWLAIFILPLTIYFLKKYFREGLFFILLIIVSFSTPLILTVETLQGELSRTNFLTSLFWNLGFGLFLGSLFLFFKNKGQKLLMFFLILVVIFQGVLYLILHSVFPGIKRDQPLLAMPPKLTQAEISAFDWIKKQTTIDDYFLAFDGAAGDLDYNLKFVTFTGRFASNFYTNWDKRFPVSVIPEMISYQKIKETCDPQAIRELNYGYLYVDENWIEGLEDKCLANNNLGLEFKTEDKNNFVRIYKVLNQ